MGPSLTRLAHVNCAQLAVTEAKEAHVSVLALSDDALLSPHTYSFKTLSCVPTFLVNPIVDGWH